MEHVGSGHCLYRRDPTVGITIPVEKRLRNPGWNPTDNRNDILIIKLKNASTKTPVTLEAEISTPKANATVTAIGFGDISQGGSLSPVLLQVNLNVISFQTCKAY